MTYGAVMLANAGVVLAVMAGAWRLSLRLRRADVVDAVWGLGFVAVAWVTWLLTDGAPARKDLLVAMATVWGLRLALYLAWRMRGRGEDRRYAAMRRRLGDRFDQVSLFSVFLLQGVLLWIVSLPLQIGQVPATPGKIGLAGVLGLALWCVGMFFETVGDWQLARFKSKPWNEGRVLETGLWRYTRHPNYSATSACGGASSSWPPPRRRAGRRRRGHCS